MRTLRVLQAIGLLSLITGGGFLLTAFFPSVLELHVEFLKSQDAPINADLIVVLSGHPVPRSLWARDLYKKGFSRKILLIPPHPDPLRPELEKIGIKKFLLKQRILTASGVPLSSIHRLPTHAKNTKDEARLVGNYISEHGVKSLLLVTSTIISRRQCWTFKQALSSVRISCQPSTYDRIRYNRKTTLRVINEYLKLAANVLGRVINEYLKLAANVLGIY